MDVQAEVKPDETTLKLTKRNRLIINLNMFKSPKVWAVVFVVVCGGVPAGYTFVGAQKEAKGAAPLSGEIETALEDLDANNETTRDRIVVNAREIRRVDSVVKGHDKRLDNQESQFRAIHDQVLILQGDVVHMDKTVTGAVAENTKLLHQLIGAQKRD